MNVSEHLFTYIYICMCVFEAELCRLIKIIRPLKWHCIYYIFTLTQVHAEVYLIVNMYNSNICAVFKCKLVG